MSEPAAQSVLVVDDSPDVHRLADARLGSEGVSLLHAHAAAEALEAAREHLPDPILLELDMPDTDGMTLCRQLKEESARTDIPITFLTGTMDVATKVQAFERERTEIRKSASLGVAGSDRFDDASQVSSGVLLQAADEALY